MKQREFITTTVAADDIGYAIRTIQAYCKRGWIKSKKFGTCYMIDRKDWEDWKNRNIRTAS